MRWLLLNILRLGLAIVCYTFAFSLMVDISFKMRLAIGGLFLLGSAIQSLEVDKE